MISCFSSNETCDIEHTRSKITLVLEDKRLQNEATSKVPTRRDRLRLAKAYFVPINQEALDFLNSMRDTMVKTECLRLSYEE